MQVCNMSVCKHTRMQVCNNAMRVLHESYDFPEEYHSYYAGVSITLGIYFYHRQFSVIYLKHISVTSQVCTSLILLDFATMHNTVLVFLALNIYRDNIKFLRYSDLDMRINNVFNKIFQK